jgi:hypothetical protein
MQKNPTIPPGRNRIIGMTMHPIAKGQKIVKSRIKVWIVRKMTAPTIGPKNVYCPPISVIFTGSADFVQSRGQETLHD